jgi:hypothetical protein
MTTTHHQRLHGKSGSLTKTSSPMTMSPPSETVHVKGIDVQPQSPTDGEARIESNKGLPDRDRKNKTCQAEGVECDWQTVFWRLPTPQPSNTHIVPSSAATTAPCQASAISTNTSPSGLASHVAEDEAVTLGEKLAREMIWGKNEDLIFPELDLVRLLLYILLTLGCQG